MLQDKNQVGEQPVDPGAAILLLQIGRLSRLIAFIGFGYAVFSTAVNLYGIVKVADNSEMWTYYKTIPGFINILVMLLSGLLYWFMSWQLYTFSDQLVQAVHFNKQEYFHFAWQYFNRLLLVADLLLLLFILLTASYFFANYN